MRRRVAANSACAVMLALVTTTLLACNSDEGARVEPTADQVVPRALTLDDVKKYAAGSPQRAVLNLWYNAALGSPPDIVAAYHPLVRRRVGAPQIAGAYDLQRSFMQDAPPTITGVRRSLAGTQVALAVKPSKGRAKMEAFLLRRQGRTWRVAYDTFLASALNTFTQSQVDATVGEQPSRRAVRAGRAISARYRNIFLGG